MKNNLFLKKKKYYVFLVINVLIEKSNKILGCHFKDISKSYRNVISRTLENGFFLYDS